MLSSLTSSIGDLGPFSVPLGAFLVAIVAILAGAVNQSHTRRVQAEQRMAMLARGMSVEDIERLVGSNNEADQPRAPRDVTRAMSTARRTALVLLSTGIGIILFFVTLTLILHEHDVLSGAAVGLVPLAIGGGFWIDYRLQAREIARFGLEAPSFHPTTERLP